MRNLTDNEKEKTGFLLNEFFENRIDNALEETLKRSKRFQPPETLWIYHNQSALW